MDAGTHGGGGPSRPEDRRAWRRFGGLPEVRWAALAAVFFAAAASVRVGDGPPVVEWTLWAVCFAAGGWEPARDGIRALREGILDVDVLMVVAAVVAAAIGQVLDGGLLIVIFSTSGAVEAIATRQTRDSVRSLLSLAPEQATLLSIPGSGQPSERRIPAGELRPGDVILIRPGELVAADGEVVLGATDVDQSSVTGEHVPVPKDVGDTVYSGTLNTTGSIRVRVDRPASDSVVARIVALVEEASATKATTQLWIERIEQRYSVAVVLATLAFVAVPMLVTDWSFERTLLRAMTFMIVASPCAVVLATMPPLLSAVANAGRHGVLVKSTVVMERIATVDAVALDKTGTVTEGRPQVAGVTVDPLGPLTAPEVLVLAGSAEQHSEHPLGTAIAAAAQRLGVALPHSEDFRAMAGRGVTAVVDGRRVEVLKPAVTTTPPVGWSEEAVVATASTGGTAVVVTADGAAIGVISLTDTVRADARSAVSALDALLEHPAVLLTGDNRRAADHVATTVGIRRVHAELLPQDKVEAIRQLQAQGQCLMVVGDGVNDAPALAAADLGIAMGGSGSDLTLQAADGVILRDRLATLPSLVGLSRRARRMVLQNLGLAVTAIVVLVGLDVAGLLPLPLGVAGHEGSTVVIGLNGLRLLRGRAWADGSRVGGPEDRRPDDGGRVPHRDVPGALEADPVGVGHQAPHPGEVSGPPQDPVA